MRDNTDPQTLGLTIRHYAQVHDCTITKAADDVYAFLATAPERAQNGLLGVLETALNRPELASGSQIAHVRSNGAAPGGAPS